MATATKKKPTPAVEADVELQFLPIDEVHVEDGFNPRQHMDPEQLQGLADSIDQHGLLNPVIAKPNGNGAPKLIGGHRRVAAAKLAGKTHIPVLIRKGKSDELVEAIVDNQHRVDLNPLEEAMAFARLQDQGMTVDGIVEHLSVPKRRVTERLRILECPPNAQLAVGVGRLSTAHVPAIADLAGKHMELTAGLVAMWLDDPRGRPPWTEQRDVTQAAAVLELIDLTEIELASKAFKADTTDLRTVFSDFKQWGSDYNVRHSVRQALAAANLDVEFGYDLLTVALGDDTIRAAIAGGFAFEIELPPAWQGQQPTKLAFTDNQQWVQETLAPLVLVAHAKAKAAATKAVERLKASGRTAAGGAGAVDAETAKAQRKAEREKADADREAAKAYNDRLGRALLDNFSKVNLSPDVIKWLCAGLLMAPPDSYSPVGITYDVADLAACGLRFVMPEWWTEEKLKNGKVKRSYPTDKKELRERFWKWWDRATTPEEIVGRTLIAHAAAKYAKSAAAMSKDQTYTRIADHSRGGSFNKLMEKLVGGKLPGVAAKYQTNDDPKALVNVLATEAATGPLADELNDVDGQEVDEAHVTKAAQLTADEKAVLLARTDPKWTHGGDAKPLGGLFALLPKMTQKQVVQLCGSLRRRGLLADPQSGGYIVTDLGDLVARHLREPKGNIAAKARRAQKQWDRDGVLTAEGKKAIAAVKAKEGAKVVVVLPQDPTIAGQRRLAHLMPDVHPSNPDGLAKVIYTESSTSAWIARKRILKTEQPPADAPKAAEPTRAQQALALVKARPGIAIPELAEAMGVKQNYLYRIMPDLAEQGLITKSGRGWHERKAAS